LRKEEEEEEEEEFRARQPMQFNPSKLEL